MFTVMREGGGGGVGDVAVCFREFYLYPNYYPSY